MSSQTNRAASPGKQLRCPLRTRRPRTAPRRRQPVELVEQPLGELGQPVLRHDVAEDDEPVVLEGSLERRQRRSWRGPHSWLPRCDGSLTDDAGPGYQLVGASDVGGHPLDGEPLRGDLAPVRAHRRTPLGSRRRAVRLRRQRLRVARRRQQPGAPCSTTSTVPPSASATTGGHRHRLDEHQPERLLVRRHGEHVGGGHDRRRRPAGGRGTARGRQAELAGRARAARRSTRRPAESGRRPAARRRELVADARRRPG